MSYHCGNDLLLGSRLDGRGPLIFPADSRNKHLYIAGATGAGKSKFLENLIRQHILGWHKHKCGALIIDVHGDLTDSILAWLRWKEIDSVPIIPIDFRPGS